MAPIQLLLLSALVTSPLTLASAQPIEHDALSIEDTPQIQNPSHQQRLMPNENEPQRRQLPLQDLSLSYRCFSGDPQAYPAVPKWLSYSTLWDLNREDILSASGGDTYLQHYIQVALEDVSSAYEIDPRFLLVILVEDFKGNINTVRTGSDLGCRILHAYQGVNLDPLSLQSSITTTLKEGIEGASQRGPSLHDLLASKLRFADVEIGGYFAVASAWKSGSVKEGDSHVIPPGNGRGEGLGDNRFVNDIANRLMGWNGRGRGFKSCTEGNAKDNGEIQ